MLDNVASHASDEKTCLDGKKINASTTGELGDVDLFGFEKQPTLTAKKHRIHSEKAAISEAIELIASMEANIVTFLEQVKSDNQANVTSQLRSIITKLSYRVKELREAKVSKRNSLQKLKGVAGENWKSS